MRILTNSAVMATVIATVIGTAAWWLGLDNRILAGSSILG
jgi:hypothetical protein